MLCLVATACLAACEGRLVIPEAIGPAPIVEVDAAFGEAPLSGFLHITPFAGSSGWRWSIQGLGSEREEVTGVADSRISIPYRFETAGVHPIRVELVGPEGPVVLEKHVVVHDPATDFEIIAQRPVREIWEAQPEGMTIDPTGRELYAAAYLSGELVRLDSGTLGVLDRLELPVHRVQGLTVTPSGALLLSAHEKQGLSIVDLEEFEVLRQTGPGRWFVRALNEDHVLVTESGAGRGDGLRRLDFAQWEIEATAEDFIPGDFDVDPAGQRVAVVNYTTRSVDILEASFLTRILSIFLEEYHLLYVAFDPREEKLYATGVGPGSNGRFFVLDLTTGLVLESISLGPAGSGYSYNPTATFAAGKYIAFDYAGSVVIVDTDLDLPRYRFEPQGSDVVLWTSVAAISNSDFLYILNGPEGSLWKIRVR